MGYKKMTVQERIDDIVKRTGMSEDIIRRVLVAEKESIVESLKRGEKATMMGRCVMEPGLKVKAIAGEGIRQMIVVKCTPAYSIVQELATMKGYKQSELEYISDEDMENIVTLELNSLG